jgi:Heparinase II/III-like protein
VVARDSRDRLVIAFAALAATLALGALASAGAGAFTPAGGVAKHPPHSEVNGLRHASCPVPDLIAHARHYSPAVTRHALHGRFKIHGHLRHLVPPVNWGQDPYHSQAYRSTLASLKWLSPLLSAYQHGKKRALVRARNLALDWIRRNPLHHPPSDKSWFNKVIGDRAPTIAYIARASKCAHILTKKQAIKFVGSIDRHGRELASPDVYIPTNHGLFMDYGLFAMARESPYLKHHAAWERLAPRRFKRTLLGRVFPDEGFWLENSSSYHLAARVITHKFVHLAHRKSPRRLTRLARRMDRVGGWLIEPDGKRVLLGDSNLKSTARKTLARSRRDNGLLWLPKSGVSIVKRPGPRPSFLLFAATFQNASHNQADALTFDLYGNGERITTDSGLYDKDNDRYQFFSRSSFSHSVMTIDGKGFPLGGKYAYGSGLRAKGKDGGWFALEGVNPLARRQRVKHNRLLLYQPGVALVVVDFARSHRHHTYTRYFQLGPDLHVDRHGKSLDLTGNGGFVARLSWSGTARSKLRLVRGHRKHPVGGFVFPHYRKRVPRTTAELRSRGRNVSQVATFALDHSRIVRAGLHSHAGPRHAVVTLKPAHGKPTVIRVVRRGKRLRVHARGPQT